MDLRALITGASGFVGTYMTRCLLDAGMNVIGISRSKGLVDGKENSEFRCDIKDNLKLKSIINSYKPDYVVHLAGPAFIPNSINEPQATYNTVFDGTLNLLECLRTLELKSKVLFISSADVYGDGNGIPLTESASLRPKNPYASAKVCSEILCKQYHESYGMEIVVARPFNHTGPGQSEDFVCSSFARQVATVEGHSKLKLFTGNIDVERDFLDVRDVVDAYKTLLYHGISGEIYNVCSGKATLIRSIVGCLIEHAGIKDYDVIIDDNRARKRDIPTRVGDNTKVKMLSDWQPKYTLEQTIADLYDWWKGKLHVNA